jgi:uncharacterized membrane protein
MAQMENPPQHHLTAQLLIGNLLRTGVLVSAAVVLLGGVLYLGQHGSQLPMLHAFQGEPDQLTHIPVIVQQALHGDSRCIIQAGLLILILTPITRVVLSIVVFALEKDRLYVGITLVVLMLLLYSLMGNSAV